MIPRRFLWLASLIGAVGLSAVPEAKAAPSKTASKAFHSLLTTPAKAKPAISRQTILQQLLKNRITLLDNLKTLRTELRLHELTRPQFFFNRQVSLAVYRAEQSYLLFELRYGRPPLTPGF